jgi:hypothetical protein
LLRTVAQVPKNLTFDPRPRMASDFCDLPRARALASVSQVLTRDAPIMLSVAGLVRARPRRIPNPHRPLLAGVFGHFHTFSDVSPGLPAAVRSLCR